MKINGIENMSVDALKFEIEQGGKFVIFQYCISVLILTFRRSSDIYFIKNGQSASNASAGYSLLSLFFGWWGLPWGPIYTLEALYNNSKGGKDVTKEVLESLNRFI